jgi:small subunit ribosomal protein S8
MNIQTIKFLNQLKNASSFNRECIDVMYSKNILSIVKVLYEEGFLQSFKIVTQLNYDPQVRYILVIQLRYFYDKSIFKKLKIVSSPARVIYFNFLNICKFSAEKNVLFFSTSKGILTLLECKKQQIGGALFFIC